MLGNYINKILILNLMIQNNLDKSNENKKELGHERL